MSKNNILIVSTLLIAVEFILPFPGPLTFLGIYVLMARPLWFKKAVDVFYSP